MHVGSGQHGYGDLRGVGQAGDEEKTDGANPHRMNSFPDVAHALVRAASALLPTPFPGCKKCRDESRHGRQDCLRHVGHSARAYSPAGAAAGTSVTVVDLMKSSLG